MERNYSGGLVSVDCDILDPLLCQNIGKMPHVNHEYKYDVSDAVFYVDVGFSSEALGPAEFSVLDSSEEPDQFML